MDDKDRKFIEEVKSYAWEKVCEYDNYTLFDKAKRATLDFIKYVCQGTYEDLSIPSNAREKLDGLLATDLNRGEEETNF